MTGETAKKKPDGSIEWIPFRKTSEFKLNVAAISPNASFAQPSVTKNFGDTAFASPTLTNPSG